VVFRGQHADETNYLHFVFFARNQDQLQFEKENLMISLAQNCTVDQ
jgi:hypothetical protein